MSHYTGTFGPLRPQPHREMLIELGKPSDPARGRTWSWGAVQPPSTPPSQDGECVPGQAYLWPVLVSVEHTLTIVTTAHKLATVIGLVSGYALSLRPRMLRGGATNEEVRRPYPGADVVSGGKRDATMAVTISAPPSRRWPWLVQLECDRAGWYSWDRLDNGGVPSVERIHPEWQEITVGERLTSKPSGASTVMIIHAMLLNFSLGIAAREAAVVHFRDRPGNHHMICDHSSAESGRTGSLNESRPRFRCAGSVPTPGRDGRPRR
jgi:hypothetical protein